MPAEGPSQRSHRSRDRRADMAQMDPLLVHDDTVMDKEPLAKTTALGWEATRKNFEVLFRVPKTQDHSVWDRAFKSRAT